MIQRECPICGKIYFASPYSLKHNKQTTCSRKCSYVLRGINQRKQVEAICKTCGNAFNTTLYKIENGRGIYCSRKCQHPPHIVICQHCGKEFRTPPTGNTAYCSDKCFHADETFRAKRSETTKAAWQKPEVRQNIMEGIRKRSQDPAWQNAPHFQKGDKHPRYKGNRRARELASRYEYKAWRKAVLSRDNFTCQHCFVRGGVLVAHHIKQWSQYPDLRFDVNNGLTLCTTCHDKVHGRRSRA